MSASIVGMIPTGLTRDCGSLFDVRGVTRPDPDKGEP